MTNDYEVNGEMTVIFVRTRGDSKTSGQILECLIDTEDLPLVEDIKNCWYAQKSHKEKNWYIKNRRRTGPRKEGKVVEKMIHRIIMDAPPKFVVDHINHNTLDNRKCNLRIVSQSINTQNHLGPNDNNMSSRERNVTWDKAREKWMVKIQAHGKKIFIGRFESLEDAKKASECARTIYFPHSFDVISSSENKEASSEVILRELSRKQKIINDCQTEILRLLQENELLRSRVPVGR